MDVLNGWSPEWLFDTTIKLNRINHSVNRYSAPWESSSHDLEKCNIIRPLKCLHSTELTCDVFSLLWRENAELTRQRSRPFQETEKWIESRSLSMTSPTMLCLSLHLKNSRLYWNVLHTIVQPDQQTWVLWQKKFITSSAYNFAARSCPWVFKRYGRVYVVN